MKKIFRKNQLVITALALIIESGDWLDRDK